MDAKYIQRKSYPSPKKNPHVLPQGKLVFAGGQNPPRLSLLQKFKKDTLPLSPLASLHEKPLSLSPYIFWQTHPEHTLPLSFLPLVSVHNKSLSLSLKALFVQTHPVQQKTIIRMKIIVVRNPLWFRKHTVSACWTMSIQGVDCDGFFFPCDFYPSVNKNIKVLLKREQRSRGKRGIL